MTSKRIAWRVAALAAALALVAAACGGNNDDAAPAPTATSTAAPSPNATDAPAQEPPPAATESPEPGPAPETAPVSFAGFSGGEYPELAPPTAVPGFSGTAMGGGPFEWTPGQAPAAIVFLAHWCPGCQAEVAELTGWLSEGNQLPDGVEFFGVSTRVNADRDKYPPSQWLSDEGWPFPVMLDDGGSNLAEAFGLTGTPFWAFIDADGQLVEASAGRLSPESLADRLNQLVGSGAG